MAPPCAHQANDASGDYACVALVAVVDTETTSGPERPGDWGNGPHTPSERIIQIAVLTCDTDSGAVVERWGTFIDPGVPVDERSTKVHGLTSLDLLVAPSLAGVRDQIVRRVEGRYLLGYNAIGFDAPVLAAELARVGASAPWLGVLDPSPIVRAIDRFLPGGGYRLTETAARWKLPMPEGAAHDARYDAEVTWLIWRDARRRDSRQFSDNLETMAAHCAKLRAQQEARRAENVGRRR